MGQDYFGTQQVTDADRAYAGSRFSEVRNAVFANPYQKVWGGHGEPPMPMHEVILSNLLRGIPPFGRRYEFGRASARTLDSNADLRWGTDGKGFRRILHPNGVCLTGWWEITEETGYSGYFRKGSKALVVGRYSTCCAETRRGHSRSLALVGKLFPTTDPNHAEPLRTANFITQEDFGGERTDYINDAEVRNAPDTHAWRRGWGTPILLVTGAVLKVLDRKYATIRQLYPIAELGKPRDEPTRTPRFMRLLVAPGQPRIEGRALDFRDEVMAHIFDPDDPTPKRTLTFHIEVTDEGTTRSLPGLERRTFRNWRHIGRLTFDNAVASYNGDFVLHFNHPISRSDPNDPATVTRVDERRVR
jgi:hypothetical protein